MKSIQSIEIELPFKKGVYAITGSNGIGKSTLLNVLSKLVYKGALKAYLHYDGTPDSKIVYIVEGKKTHGLKLRNNGSVIEQKVILRKFSLKEFMRLV